MGMLIKLYRQNTDERLVRQVACLLRNGGVVIYPTDSVYAFGCALGQQKAIDRIKQIKGKEAGEFAIVCSDLSHISDYARVDNPTFKLLKKNLPGPFTFILNASNNVPDKFLDRRKTIGIRIPDDPIALAIVRELGMPLVTTSVKDIDNVQEYTTDPELIHEHYSDIVDMVVDGGYGNNEASTVVDCTGDEPEVARQGIGELIL